MRIIKKLIVFLLVMVLVLPGSQIVAKAKESQKIIVERLGGIDRHATASKVSATAYPKGSRNVVIVGDYGEVDALTGTLLASSLNAPLLFTYQDKLCKETLKEIIREKADMIYILGGENAVSKSVKLELEKLATVKRIDGKNRFETAAQVAKLVAKKMLQLMPLLSWVKVL